MSADNYLLVRPMGKGWTVTMEFASDDEPRPVDPARDPFFETKHAAMDRAFEWEQETYVEYGVSLDDTSGDLTPKP